MIQQGQHTALELFQTIAERLTSKLKTQIKTFFLPLLLGALFALARRRTVTTWLRAAGLSDDYRNIFYHMPSIGRKSQKLFDEMLKCILEHLGEAIASASSIRIVLDDSPTKRYGNQNWWIAVRVRGTKWSVVRRMRTGGIFYGERYWRRIFMMLYGEQD